MQSFMCVGNISQDAKTMGSSGKVAVASIAVDRGMKGMDGKYVTDFLTLRFIGEGNAQRAVRDCVKGARVEVIGSVCHEKYSTQSGETRYSDFILVNRFMVVRASQSQNQAPAQKNEGFMDIPSSADDSGLPFS